MTTVTHTSHLSAFVCASSLCSMPPLGTLSHCACLSTLCLCRVS